MYIKKTKIHGNIKSIRYNYKSIELKIKHGSLNYSNYTVMYVESFHMSSLPISNNFIKFRLDHGELLE